MNVVIDTNILVSGLYSRNGAPAKVLSLVLSGVLTPCYDFRILQEYKEVLLREKFHFSKSDVETLLKWIQSQGQSLVAPSLDVAFVDEDDKKFYELAKCFGVYLVTGNMKHYPKDSLVIGVNELLEIVSKTSAFPI